MRRYHAGAYTYALPYRTADVAVLEPFDYWRLANDSRFANANDIRVNRRARQSTGGIGQTPAGGTAGTQRGMETGRNQSNMGGAQR